MAVPDDPNSIDVSLSLLDGQSLAAITALTTQLAANAQLLSGLKATDPQDYVRGQQRAAGTLGGTPAGQPSSGASVGFRETPAAPAADPRSALQRLRDLTTKEGRRQEARDYGATEREQYLYRSGMGLDTDPHLFSLRGAGPPDIGPENGPVGGPSSGASRGSREPEWRNILTANPRRWEEAQEGFRLPQFGSPTIQDKLNLGSDFLARMAEGRYRRAQEIRRDVPIGPLVKEDQEAYDSAISASERPGMMAAYLRMGAEQSGQIVTAGQEIQRFTGMFQGISGRGTQLGYERGGEISIPGTDIGFANPFSGSLKEGLRQILTSKRLSLQGGINGDQAKAIQDAVAGYGYSGDEGQGIAFDAIAPLVARGMDAGDVTSVFDKTMRQGNNSIEEFVTTMSDLQDVSKTLNLTLGETLESLGEFTEWGSSQGANRLQALNLGKQVSASNNLAPGVNAQIAQTNLFQGLASTQGFYPGQQGLMSSNQFNETMYQSIHMAEQMTRGFRQEKKDPITGEITSTEDESQRAAMANILGISPDVIEKTLREEKTTKASSRVNSRLNQMNEDIKARETLMNEKYKGVNRSNFFGDNEGGYLSKINEGWKSVRKDLESLAPGEAGDTDNKERVKYFEQIRDLEKKGGRDRTEAARALLEKRRGEMSGPSSDDNTDANKVTLDLTDSAKRFFKQIESRDTSQAKRDAQGGGKSTASKIIDTWTSATGLPSLFGGD